MVYPDNGKQIRLVVYVKMDLVMHWHNFFNVLSHVRVEMVPYEVMIPQYWEILSFLHPWPTYCSTITNVTKLVSQSGQGVLKKCKFWLFWGQFWMKMVQLLYRNRPTICRNTTSSWFLMDYQLVHVALELLMWRNWSTK